jgi:CDP-glycerol:poly(glycerophosphate) glycerophosphotransferase
MPFPARPTPPESITGDAHRLLDGARVPGPGGYVPGESVPGEVVVYFADDPRKLYQLRQWLPVLERLHERHPTVVVTRQQHTFEEVRAQTTLRCVLAPTFPDLVGLYEASDFKVAIYVNNSVHNFQSLTNRRMLHVHVNHGESDKVCMVSNQVKAYDRVFVAGEAAIARHAAALLEFDLGALVPVGRPQLDLHPESMLPPTSRRTILYAPTWEGENESNNYTSVDVFGPAIVAATLAVPDVRVVYKPHPRVVTSPTPAMAAAHARIAAMLSAEPHRVIENGDILAVLPGCDLMITDVSSVGLDFLYLETAKPLFVTDRRDDRERLHTDAPVSRCADVVDAAGLPVLAHRLGQRLVADLHRPGREELRRHYFGDLLPGESTERFMTAVDEVIAARDRGLRRLEQVPVYSGTEASGA